MNSTERTHCEYWDAYPEPCKEPAKFRWSGRNYCAFHYGPPNRELRINKPDEVVP